MSYLVVGGCANLSGIAYRVELAGRVQGVGLRPFIYRLALQYEITGWIENGMGQVLLHVEGQSQALSHFFDTLIKAPEPVRLHITEKRLVDVESYDEFVIRPSRASVVDVHLLPDLPPCESCLNELFDPNNRRYRYPFINCSHCGPRYTLIYKLPYDRANTSMLEFPLCQTCEQEYSTVTNRRFHAEPLACEVCGPALSYCAAGERVECNEVALSAAINAIKQGKIIAVKGVGGYHLMCDANNPQAIQRLRQRKRRPHKPLAVMGTEPQLAELVVLDQTTLQALHSPARPIVLAKTKVNTADIAPNLNEIGVMLPNSPLHSLLLADIKTPLIATSANLSGEPVLTDNDEVERRLAQIADGFLHHNRAILHPADDPLLRVIAGSARPLRVGRGNAPLELELPFYLDEPLSALGGQMKNSIALAWQNRLVLSPHIGELDTPRAQKLLADSVEWLSDLYQVTPKRVLLDAHPNYGYRRWAMGSGLPVSNIYHHYAHASQLVGEYPEASRWLLFTWDGVGLGDDQTLWGGEALLGQAGGWQRVASLRPFYLPAGDKAGREPWLSAAALCWQAGIDYHPAKSNELLYQAWKQRVNCHQTSSVGRLFDGAAALLGLCDEVSFEGQAAMWLEAIAANVEAEPIELPLVEDLQGVWRADWQPLLTLLLDDDLSVAQRAATFHETLAQLLLHQAEMLRKVEGEFVVGLSGGVFQNRRLSERVLSLLGQQGFKAYLPQSIPVSDAGLAYGQVLEYYYSNHK